MITQKTQQKTVLKKIVNRKKYQIYYFMSSVYNFSSMRSPVELTSLLIKFFCYVTEFDEGRNWRPANEVYFFKSYYFFERIS